MKKNYELSQKGQYCGAEGLSEPTGNCSEGFYCSGGASESMPALLGMFSWLQIHIKIHVLESAILHTI